LKGTEFIVGVLIRPPEMPCVCAKNTRLPHNRLGTVGHTPACQVSGVLQAEAGYGCYGCASARRPDMSDDRKLITLNSAEKVRGYPKPQQA
jgi:hypothetical protein